MNTDTNCIFCKIAKHEIPAHIVYEDDDFIAFLDIHPNAKGHTLLIPKNHQEWWLDLSDSDLANTFIVAKKISESLKGSLETDYVRINVVGTDIPHFHIHLIPLKLSDEVNSLRKVVEYKEGEAEEIVKKIKLNA